MSNRFVVGTRGSALARWQTDHVTSKVTQSRKSAAKPAVDVEVRVITTQGDVNLADRLAGKLEKGFFTAELESELLSSKIDWAVHSLKDLPTRITDGLQIGAVLERARVSDILIAKPDMVDLERKPGSRSSLPLKPGARVGTSSLRRDAMLRAFAANVLSQPLRGNVPTRIEKLRSGNYDAIVLAAAGVERLGLDLSGLVVLELDPRRWQPAPGQGSVAIETRANDARTLEVIAPLDDMAARTACQREREFLRVLEGGCSTPFGAFVDGRRAYLGMEHGGRWRACSVAVPAGPVDLDAAFIHDALAHLQRSEHYIEETSDDKPLWQPL